MTRQSSISCVIAFAGLAVGASPALAQHPRLEDAWAVCASISDAANMPGALARQAATAGFPLYRDKMHAIGDSEVGSLVLRGDVSDVDGEQECAVTSTGGDQSTMIARAERFWSARGHESYASTLPGIVWAAMDPDDDGLGVWLKTVRAGVWQMTVNEQW